MDPGASREVCNDSSTPEAFIRAKEWLSYCVEHDGSCTPPDKNFVPKRLVNVNLENKAGDPFLVEPTRPTKYACLSYCWGEDSDDVLRTNQDNIEAHFAGIPMSSMPGSIRDAIKVCRNLEIPHLWVDSLCIMQGNREEWLHDSSQMDATYLNSHLTITALEPANCKSGFLGNQLFGIPEQQPVFGQAVRYYGPAVDKYSLDSRGWCLQEALLPNRRLCYSGEEMSWECLCRRVCECSHYSWPDYTESSYFHELEFGELSALLKTTSLAVKPLPRRSPQTAYSMGRRLTWLRAFANAPTVSAQTYSFPTTRTRELWRHLVGRYSKRTLSHRTDKLAALAGLTKLTLSSIAREEGSPDEYFAGLWKKEIAFDLAWRVERFPADLSNQNYHDTSEQVYYAPSWSWASSTGSIRYDFSLPIWEWKYEPRAVDQCALIGAECTPELPGDSTGPISDGRIRLKGQLSAVEIGIPPRAGKRPAIANDDTIRASPTKESTAFVRAQNLQAVETFLDSLADPNMKSDDVGVACWIRGVCEMGCSCSWDNDRETQFYCFRLFSWVGKTWSDRYMGPETWFLLLKKSSAGGVFHRVGVGRWDTWHNSKTRICPLFEQAEETIIDIV
ncbi:heterokaryon incompatibility protein [Rutstroemia sp. NJR-2017a BVV2]|nr:heterokaryon incompatibility protein [Rutstroemia sp. NJR-2017a BVV2]